MSTTDYGRSYWCVKRRDAPEVYVMADRVEVTPTGALIFWAETTEAKDGSYDRVPRNNPFPSLGFAPGEWTAFYAASLLDGSAVAVEHWEGEVVRS